MQGEHAAIGEALAAVQRLLDRLTDRGQHAAAFEIARAQFSASVRASWPGNVVAIAAAIDRAISEAGDALNEQDKSELREAANVLRQVQHP